MNLKELIKLTEYYVVKDGESSKYTWNAYNPVDTLCTNVLLFNTLQLNVLYMDLTFRVRLALIFEYMNFGQGMRELFEVSGYELSQLDNSL